MSGSVLLCHQTIAAHQWRTQKIFTGGFIQWHMAVICIWCALFATSYSCFQAKFVDIIGIFFYMHSPYFCKQSSPIHSPYNKVFIKYQAQGEGLNPNPNPPCVRPCCPPAVRQFLNLFQIRICSRAKQKIKHDISRMHSCRLKLCCVCIWHGKNCR